MTLQLYDFGVILRKWTVLFDDVFNEEFSDLDHEVQDQLLAHALLLEKFGLQLGRPTVDTLKGFKALKYERVTI